MVSFWKQWTRQAGSSHRGAKRSMPGSPVSAHIERYESRCVLSVTSVFNAGALSVSSNGADAIKIDVGTDGNVTLNGAALQATSGETSGPVAANTVTSLTVTGGSGRNNINLSAVNATTFPALTTVSVDGGDGVDIIRGSDLGDSITGGLGSDSIVGNGGNDSISGGAGYDTSYCQMLWTR